MKIQHTLGLLCLSISPRTAPYNHVYYLTVFRPFSVVIFESDMLMKDQIHSVVTCCNFVGDISQYITLEAAAQT